MEKLVLRKHCHTIWLCLYNKDYVRTSLDAPIETRAERDERLYEEALFQYQIDTFFNEQEWYDADYDDDYEDDYDDDEDEADSTLVSEAEDEKTESKIKNS